MSCYFWPIFTPLPLVTLCHTSWDPPKVRHTSRTPPPFRRPSKKNPDKNPLYKFSLNCSRGFVRRVCQGVFSLEGFVRCGFCPFPFLSEYICYNRKLNITLNFRFHMYDKNFYKCDVTGPGIPLPSVTNCHTFSDPLEHMYFMDGPLSGMWWCSDMFCAL